MDARTTTPNGELVDITIPTRAVVGMVVSSIHLDPPTGLWTAAFAQADVHGLSGWKVGWYSNEEGTPLTLVATTWVAL